MKIELQPFSTPNFVLGKMPPRQRQDGIGSTLSWPLSEVDADELARLCDEFRAEVFRKAGKPDPKVGP